jgi:NADH-quinone oxidoreductase subunit N
LFLPELYQLLIVGLLFIQALGTPSTAAKGAGVDRPSVSWVPFLAFLGVILAAASLCRQGLPEALGENGHGVLMFWGAYKVDGLSQFFKLAIAVGFFITTLNAAKPSAESSIETRKMPDYFLFLALSCWGLMFLSSAVEMIAIYISLEISSYSLYAIIPLRSKDRRAAEAGIKYIMFGAAATAIALYGYSLVLASQHTSYIGLLLHKDWSWAGSPMAVLGLGLFLSGMFFKLALFPFHFWCPDVYEGASNETAAFVATLPKLGAVVVLVRFAAMLKPGLELTTAIAIFGAVSMTFGNLAALAQRDLKRLLGYSSVAHAGYVTLGLVSGTPEGLAAAAFYSLIYLLMNLACFWVLCRLAPDGRNLTFKDLDGLYKRQPVLAFTLAVAAFALVGLPPTAGFTGKFFLLASAWNHGYNWLVIVAVVNTAFAIYYYLSIARHAYTHDPDEEAKPAEALPTPHLVWAGIFASVLLLLGALPGPVFQFAVNAGKQLFP